MALELKVLNEVHCSLVLAEVHGITVILVELSYVLREFVVNDVYLVPGLVLLLSHEFVFILRNHGVDDLFGLKLLLEVEVELL